jgi:hypothetical protein
MRYDAHSFYDFDFLFDMVPSDRLIVAVDIAVAAVSASSDSCLSFDHLAGWLLRATPCQLTTVEHTADQQA